MKKNVKVFMKKFHQNIRPIAVGVFEHGEKILVQKCKDTATEEEFFRLLGGGIEYGEKSDEALIRELKEELNCELDKLKLLDVEENVFTYHGKLGHEVVFLYRAEVVTPEVLGVDKIKILDRRDYAYWIEKK